jgi:hypothetical protein
MMAAIVFKPKALRAFGTVMILVLGFYLIIYRRSRFILTPGDIRPISISTGRGDDVATFDSFP